MLVVERTRADGVTPCSFIVGTAASLDLTGIPTECVGLIKLSSSVCPAGVAGEDGESILGNLNSASGSCAEVGDARGNPTLGVSGAVAVPGRRPFMLRSGGYDELKSGDD